MQIKLSLNVLAMLGVVSKGEVKWSWLMAFLLERGWRQPAATWLGQHHVLHCLQLQKVSQVSSAPATRV